MPADLDACPFCNSPAGIVTVMSQLVPGGVVGYTASCDICTAELGGGSEFETPEAAAKAWNTRANQQPVQPVELPTEEMCDQARGFIMGLDLGIRTWGRMQYHLEKNSGYPSHPHIEQKAKEAYADHITKWDIAECIWLLMQQKTPVRESGKLYEAAENFRYAVMDIYPDIKHCLGAETKQVLFAADKELRAALDTTDVEDGEADA